MTYPAGLWIDLDADTKQLTDDVLFGGSPARVLRLNAAGVRALAELRAGPVSSRAAATLARRLTDAGLAHPRPAPADLDVTVVIPVLDRAAELERCLAAAGRDHPVLVVDDGSADPSAVEAVCARHDAKLVRRDVNGGPGPARNTALGLVGTEFVAFLDSDCVPPPGWITALGGHFADPLVVAVAPRISEDSAGASPLDLGDRPARVAPLTRVAYVPTAALVVRRVALFPNGREAPCDGFDESMRYGEDVDLVWRLVGSGGRIRYEPSVSVAHTAPGSRGGRLRRRFHYGTTAAPLTRRHPGAVAPLVLQPWPTLVIGAVLARRPMVALAAFATSTSLLARRLRTHGLPTRGLVRANAGGVVQTGLGVGRWGAQFAAPALAVAIARGSPWRRIVAAALLVAPPLADWARRRPPESAVRYVAATIADQAAYGAGVWTGCARERRFAAVLPTVTTKPFKGLNSDP